MRASFDIHSSTGDYSVSVGEGLVREVLDTVSHRVFLVDKRLMPQLAFINGPVIEVEATEEHKSLESMPSIIEALKKFGATRETEIVAVGGGIIQDIATFVSSVYMRGLRWHYCPTTLLGMVDSCIGGKSSINVGAYKNLVGNFHPPVRILIDLAFIKTLDASQQVSGLMESVKICYARGQADFERYLAFAPNAGLSSDTASAVIQQSLLTKKWFIETDEFDHAERLLLNFGHTFGHAVESATHFEVPHGLAVGVGMVMACHYAEQARILTAEGSSRAAKLVAHVQSLLSPLRSHLTALASLDADVLFMHFTSDKKHSQEFYRVIVPTGEGDLQRLSLERNAVNERAIRDAFEEGALTVLRGSVE